MNKSITYCKKWSKLFDEWTEFWTKEKAIKNFNKGKPIGIIVGDLHNPKYYLDVTLNVVSVEFIDDFKRPYIDYVFAKIDNRMFLNRVVLREYILDSDELKLANMYLFNENGDVHIVKSTYKPDFYQEAKGKVDVTDCYEGVPEFGEYDAFLRLERNVFSIAIE